MTKTNNKKALLSSAFALVVSVAMLIGTTLRGLPTPHLLR